jgi:hypothetical protein
MCVPKKGAHMKNSLVVARNDRDMNAFAFVQWVGIIGHSALKAALKKACTEWVKTTPEGQEAWEDTSEDFNLGDLCNHTGEPTLVAILQKYGIVGLEIDVYSDEKPANWEYDDILVGG